MSEHVLYDAGGILVTNERVAAGRRTHDLTEVTTVYWGIDKGRRAVTLAVAYCLLVPVMFTAVAQAGPRAITVAASCVALAAVALPALVMKRYSVVLVTPGYQHRAVSNLDQATAQHLAGIINQAVTARQRCCHHRSVTMLSSFPRPCSPPEVSWRAR